jgi:long-chain acyl-CoA synthetase
MMSSTTSPAPSVARPWVAHYPDGVDWNAEIDLRPIHEQVLAACARTPSAIALDFLGGTTTFGDLARKIVAFAGALQKQFGVKKGTRVALLLPNTPFYPIAYYGILRAGGTVVNTNPLYTVHELGHIVGNAGADILITLDLKQMFDKAEALVKAGHVKTVIACHFPNALPLVKKVLFSVAKRKDLTNPRKSTIADKVVRFDDMIGANHTPEAIVIDAEKDIAVQQYTGGTTGLPKGALLTHANVAANACQGELWFPGIFRPPSQLVAVLPFFHIFAMTVCLNIPLSRGVSVIMLPRFEMKGFLDMLARTGANLLPAVPTLLTALSHNSKVTREQLKHIELVVSGGAALPAELRTAFGRKSNAPLVEGYGLTEASPVVCCGPFAGGQKLLSIGFPLPATDIRFVDVDTGELAGIGENGELQVKGPQVMLGYYENSEDTEKAFMDGWLRTGDVGHMDEEGHVFLVDRIKDLIICSGFNVYPRTIEEAIADHPAVDEVNVIGVEDQYRGEAPVAFVKLREGQSVSESELKTFIAEKLNKIEIPREIIFKDELPKTLIGKLSKKELREEYAKGKAGRSE